MCYWTGDLVEALEYLHDEIQVPPAERKGNGGREGGGKGVVCDPTEITPESVGDTEAMPPTPTSELLIPPPHGAPPPSAYFHDDAVCTWLGGRGHRVGDDGG